MRCLCLIALLSLSSCSVLWSRKPPQGYDPATHGLPKCSAPKAAVAWDLALMLGSAIGSVVYLKAAKGMDAAVVGRSEGADGLRAGGVLFGVNSVAHLVSAIHGFRANDRCGAAEALFDAYLRSRRADGGMRPRHAVQ